MWNTFQIDRVCARNCIFWLQINGQRFPAGAEQGCSDCRQLGVRHAHRCSLHHSVDNRCCVAHRWSCVQRYATGNKTSWAWVNGHIETWTHFVESLEVNVYVYVSHLLKLLFVTVWHRICGADDLSRWSPGQVWATDYSVMSHDRNTVPLFCSLIGLRN